MLDVTECDLSFLTGEAKRTDLDDQRIYRFGIIAALTGLSLDDLVQAEAPELLSTLR